MTLKSFIEDRKEEMLRLLEKLVNIDSGSYVKSGIDQVGEILKQEYEQLGLQVTVHEQEEYGNHLTIRAEGAHEPEIIIIAHMDTVFPAGTAANRPFSRDEKRAYGPGVIDMKASQVAVLYAMKALIESGVDAYQNVQIVLNSDEEIGSISSRSLIEEMAKNKKYALIVEPGRADGSIVSARKGGGTYKLLVKGKGAHSGVEPEKGVSAIEELAHKVIRLHALTDYASGLTVNVGQIEGGTSSNTVAPFATAVVDVRVVTAEQAEQVDRAIRDICSTADVEGTSIELQGKINRPPMEKNAKTDALVKLLQEVGQSLGQVIKDTKTGGGSDGNFTSALGVATIDGIGPIGGGAHSDREYLEIDSLTDRTLLLAETLKRLSRQ